MKGRWAEIKKIPSPDNTIHSYHYHGLYVDHRVHTTTVCIRGVPSHMPSFGTESPCAYGESSYAYGGTLFLAKLFAYMGRFMSPDPHTMHIVAYGDPRMHIGIPVCIPICIYGDISVTNCLHVGVVRMMQGFRSPDPHDV